jgi:hypothetical protein
LNHTVPLQTIYGFTNPPIKTQTSALGAITDGTATEVSQAVAALLSVRSATADRGIEVDGAIDLTKKIDGWRLVHLQ